LGRESIQNNMQAPRSPALRLTLASVPFGLVYIWIGVQHFTNTAWFEPIVPAVLGAPSRWVFLTGVIEVLIGAGLLLPRTRKYAALTSVLFLLAVYWANLNMWVNDIPLDGTTYGNGWHVLRLLAQLGMILLSVFIFRSSKRPTEPADELDSFLSS
jgi:uncharacterized membrane protein